MNKLFPRLRPVFPLIAFWVALSSPAYCQWKPRNPVTSVKRQSDGALFTQQQGFLKIQVCTDSIIHVVYSPTTSFQQHTNYVVIKTSWDSVPWTMDETNDTVSISTARLKVNVARLDGSITYREQNGATLLQEANRWLTPVRVNGEDTYRAESFVSIYGSHEGLYGLGQHQAGVWNYRGESVDISQDNSNISVPLLVSSKGYGLYWNNESRSRFNNRFANYLYISSEVADAVVY
jgi:alpha-D-xyloside xylohydrolase